MASGYRPSAPPLQELELSEAPHVQVQPPPPAFPAAPPDAQDAPPGADGGGGAGGGAGGGEGEGEGQVFHFSAFQQRYSGPEEGEQKHHGLGAAAGGGGQESGEPEVYVIRPSPPVRDNFGDNNDDNQKNDLAGQVGDYQPARVAVRSSPSPSTGGVQPTDEVFGFAALRAKMKKDTEQEFEDLEPGSEAPEILVTENGSRFMKHKAHRDDDLNKLAIHYRTTVADIRKYNRNVVFDHLDNVHGQYIYIPLGDVRGPLRLPENEPESRAQREARLMFEFRSSLPTHLQAVTSDHNQALRAQAGKLPDQEVRVYLEQYEWDVQVAIKHWLDDMIWEIENPGKLKEIPKR